MTCCLAHAIQTRSLHRHAISLTYGSLTTTREASAS